MKNVSNRAAQYHLTSNTFLENVMPQIKINQKRFPLDGIDPIRQHKAVCPIPSQSSSDHFEE